MKDILLKNLNRSIVRFFGAFLFFLILAGCSNDDDATGGEITVNAVFLQDVNSTVPDRQVEFVRLGQLLRIEGSGFTGLKRVFINGYQTGFNPVYVSDTSMLIRVSGDTPTVEAADEVRNTIRFVKDNSEKIIEFEIRSSAPQITRISHTMPKPGEEITVYGSGLIEVTRVVFPGDVEVTSGITFDEVDGKFFTVTMPEGVATSGGSIYIESANGAAYSPAYFNFKEGVILNFDGMGGIGEFGNTIRTSQLESQVIGEGNTSQGTYVPHRPEGKGTFPAGSNRLSEVFTTGSESWRTQFTPFFPTTTPLEELAFQFDIYVPKAWNTGVLQILLINNFNGGEWSGGTYNYVPWIVDEERELFMTEGWTTVTIPFTDFYNFEAEDTEFTFADLLAFREAATYKNFGMFFNNTDVLLSNVTRSPSDVEFAATPTDVDIYTDNWRIVSLEVPTVTDFPE
ncbi:glycan-binding surface protein [Leeuwenhoekiella sp. MAR_2009_132]|uniref:glycan-binding surface protein n=1 Tax=Leeuwenhoekiella sp. MAR_2009_132 TaxID=1392489 RepID=UPI00048C845B|nr:glycan-binding surface protein [Leeuwenhoekiella sp. MAR_2009_132]